MLRNFGASPPLVSFPHLREPWTGGETVYVCGRLGQLNGTGLEGAQAKARKLLYLKAKTAADYDAADRIVEDMLSDRVLDRLVDDVSPYIVKGVPLVCVVPHPPFDDIHADGADLIRRGVKNVLPFQYMARLSVLLDAEMDAQIVQKSRVGRTKLKDFPRFLCQPCFDGAVRQNAAYILVDDVVTTGGTLAALRSHIIRGGGSVVAVTTLAHGSGQWRDLALSDGTWNELQQAFGSGLDDFWRKEIGHDAKRLTDAEGSILLRWHSKSVAGNGRAPLQCLRDRLAEAAAKGE
ncbi:phosphoribosyltransferase [Bradyrhizobium sp. 1]|uniref:phosphoribosyltransferase n=1 Tax=Bradyrhizobium sp. 1 TaxID=241591 RepID=UPI001FF8AB49|nr:phosphoribosyltransferase [Bradyrhizobium sp. 1]MCK1393681.1 phosphoribosyltransferase [Bradyrhizobium sp. 1]